MSDDEGRARALNATLAELTKRFGDGTVVRLGDASHMQVDVIPTGSLGLDIALGVGGIPRGRVTEIYGPESAGKTTLCLHIIAQAQIRGGICAFVDMEHALDPAYAERIGVRIDDLLVSQPDTGEQALEIAEALVRSGAIDVVVIDSVAALVPRAEIEGEMGDAHVGLQARLMSQALRKLSGAIKQSNTAVVFTNQLREKVGVMFGCFHYDTRVKLADGTSEKIGKIVNQRMDVEVLSYNRDTGEFEPRRIKNWFDNGRTDEFLQFTVQANGGNGRHNFASTPNHLILTENGYRRAGELRVGDCVMTSVPYYLSPIQEQVVLGSVLGDGSLRRASEVNTQLRIGHGAKQIEYAQWKQSLFAGLVKYEATNSRGGHNFDTIPMYELTGLLEQNYCLEGRGKGRKAPSEAFVERLTPLAIAIWYMDDGTFDTARQNRCSICATGLPEAQQRMLIKWFNERGIAPKLDSRGRINFDSTQTPKLHALIAPYVHPSMDYKLVPDMRGKFVPIEVEPQVAYRAVPMPIVDIYAKPQSKKTHRFDLEIEGNHCYIVDGVIVHNSPETTPGGRALKFYSSIRLDIRRVQQIKAASEVVGNRTRVRVTKNKVSAPFKETEFDIMFADGISKDGEIVDIASELGIIEKRGAFFRYNDGMLGQGRENAKQYLRENPVLADEIEDLIRQHFGLPPLGAVAAQPPRVVEQPAPKEGKRSKKQAPPPVEEVEDLME